MNKQKGFSLIELLISLFIVAIAMLGFAALQSYGSRTINASYGKQSGSLALNSYIRLFESSYEGIKDLNWDRSGNITVTCSNSDVMLKISGNTVPAKALKNAFDSLCNQYFNGDKNINADILASDFAVALERTKNVDNITDLDIYKATIALAYRPIRQGKREQDEITADDKPITVAGYCPLNADNDNAEMAQLRITDNVVCNRVEVSL